MAHRDDTPDNEHRAEQMTRDVLNMFTVERDTSLADGAGAPGSTSVGESTHVDRDDNARDDEPADRT
jgi:hypothetical protein